MGLESLLARNLIPYYALDHCLRCASYNVSDILGRKTSVSNMGMTFAREKLGQLLEHWRAFPSSIVPSFVATWRFEATLYDTPKISSVLFEAIHRKLFSFEFKMVEATNATTTVEVEVSSPVSS